MGLPKDNDLYVLDCDTSDYGIGAVLSQRQEGSERVIAYGSRLLSSAEKRYCVTRKELLAVVYFTRQFRQHLLGRHFILRTDHAALQWLQRTPEPIGQQGRWLERLAEFDFEIVHRPGLKHGNADALSRKPCRQCGHDEEALCVAATQVVEPRLEESETGGSSEPGTLQEAQKKDADLTIVRRWLEGPDGFPELAEIQLESGTVKIYWFQREKLQIKNDVL